MNFTTKEITVVALCVALIGVFAQISVPTGFVPINLSTLAIFIIGSICSLKISVMSVLVYLLLGAFGVPVFANMNAGIPYMLNVSGGFLFGYIPSIIFISLTHTLTDKIVNNVIKLVLSITIYEVASMIIYVLGSLWICYLSGSSFFETFTGIIITFAIGDFLKALASAIISPRIKKHIK